MSRKSLLTFAGASALAGLIAGPVSAAPATESQIEALRVQILAQQQLLDSQQKQLQTQQQQLQDLISKSQEAASQPKQAQTAETAPQPKFSMTANNRPTFTSADGQNSIALTSIFNFDFGAYSYHPNSASTTPQNLQNGVNARRARIGLTGKFMGDWKYDFQYDFGNYDDALTNSTSAKSGVKSGFLTYAGIDNLAVDLGYLSVPYTIDQATSNTDYMFMEHPVPQAIAIAVAAGDSRSSLGVRSFDDRYWVGGYLTGPKSGASHTTAEQLGGTLRGTYQVISTPEGNLHLGVDFSQLIKSPGSKSMSLAVQPELSIDSTAAYGLTIGSAAFPLRSASIYSAEAAGEWRSLFFQGEYFFYTFDREGLPVSRFTGGYLQTSWTLTGEHRVYNRESGAYGRIYPTSPFSLKTGGIGAWELAARVSQIDLNDHFIEGARNNSTAINGGSFLAETVGLNWYPNNNLMFRLNYEHAHTGSLYSNITSATSSQRDTGSHFNAVAARAQIAF